MLGYGAYVVFFEFCKQAFPEMGDQMVARMVAGMDVDDVPAGRRAEEARRARAVDLDLADLFVEGSDPTKVLAALRERGDAGARWLAALEAAKDPWFNVSVRRRLLPPPPVLGRRPDRAVRRAAPLRRADRAPARTSTRPTERLAEERDRIAAEYRELLDSEEEKGAFDQMLGLCRQVFPYIECAQVLLRALVHDPFFQKIRDFGALLAQRGVFAEADDVFHLRHVRGRGRPRRRHARLGIGRHRAGRPGTGSRSSPSASAIVEALSHLDAAAGAGRRCPRCSTTRRCRCSGASPRETVEAWLGGRRTTTRRRPRLSRPPPAWSRASRGCCSTSTTSARSARARSSSAR